jgi:hypothetical protein
VPLVPGHGRRWGSGCNVVVGWDRTADNVFLPNACDAIDKATRWSTGQKSRSLVRGERTQHTVGLAKSEAAAIVTLERRAWAYLTARRG